MMDKADVVFALQERQAYTEIRRDQIVGFINRVLLWEHMRCSSGGNDI